MEGSAREGERDGGQGWLPQSPQGDGVEGAVTADQGGTLHLCPGQEAG